MSELSIESLVELVPDVSISFTDAFITASNERGSGMTWKDEDEDEDADAEEDECVADKLLLDDEEEEEEEEDDDEDVIRLENPLVLPMMDPEEEVWKAREEGCRARLEVVGEANRSLEAEGGAETEGPEIEEEEEEEAEEEEGGGRFSASLYATEGWWPREEFALTVRSDLAGVGAPEETPAPPTAPPPPPPPPPVPVPVPVLAKVGMEDGVS